MGVFAAQSAPSFYRGQYTPAVTHKSRTIYKCAPSIREAAFLGHNAEDCASSSSVSVSFATAVGSAIKRTVDFD
jgi:hypothetical protein